MYISRLHIKNWRAYEDAVYEFATPREGRPLVLIGAMNGHGKTSFLMALYVGIFGRHGLRYCEGLLNKGDDALPHYRAAIGSLRRTHADPSEPTEIDISFSPGVNDSSDDTIRIIRRWHFTGANKPKPGNAFEEIEVLKSGRRQPVPQDETDVAAALLPRIESLLFPAHCSPAFFFDGEQSQKLVENAGGTGTRRALEVLFGTKLLEETQELVRGQITRIHNSHGGKRAAHNVEANYQEKVRERDQLNISLGHLQTKKLKTESRLDDLREQRRALLARLTLRQDGPEGDASAALNAFVEASSAVKAVERSLAAQLSGLGLSMALARYGEPIRRQLQDEASREEWETLSSSLRASQSKILRAIFIEPPSEDDVFGPLSIASVEQIRRRIEDALQSLQEHPAGLTETTLLGHVTSGQRARQVHLLEEHKANAEKLHGILAELEAAKNGEMAAKQAVEASKFQPTDTAPLVKQFDDLSEAIETEQRNLGACQKEIDKTRADLHSLSAQCGKLAEEIKHQGPGMELLGIATSLETTLAEVLEELQPLAIQRIEAAVTEKFREIADARFRNATVHLSPDGPALLKNEKTNETTEIAQKGGFEKRAFGIGFALALAQVTDLGLPMVIDTPLGNADSEYRPRVLKALAESGLDQVIILTHDEEVDRDLASRFSRKTNQKFLVKYDRKNHRSEVFPNTYF